MDKRRVDAVKESVGTRDINVLTEVFRQSTGVPPGVRADRFRADHADLLDVLDRLEANQLFLQRQKPEATNYQVRVYCLPILADSHAQALVTHMNQIYVLLKDVYRDQLSEQVKVSALEKAVDAGDPSAKGAAIKEALYYMADSHAVWSGLTSGFPYAEDAAICVSEAVLRYNNFDAVLDEFFDWHILNPKRRVNAVIGAVSDERWGKPISNFLENANSPQPKWYDELDDSKKALVLELDVALKSGLSALPTMGVRTLLESIMLDHIKEDQRSFKEYLAAFAEVGFVTKQHAALLEGILDAGHAAVHRAYFPNTQDLQTCVDAVKHLMEGLYILKPKVDAMSANTPKRNRSRDRDNKM